jgi:hypothetical protein
MVARAQPAAATDRIRILHSVVSWRRLAQISLLGLQTRERLLMGY